MNYSIKNKKQISYILVIVSKNADAFVIVAFLFSLYAAADFLQYMLV